jgi:lipoate-protein ligase A
MLLVDNQNITDPHLNLALEEHLLRNVQVGEPMLLLSINEPSVIIGRNQNVFEETDPDYLQSQDIHLLRRLSGGGAVYHDLGNLNYSFITQGKGDLHNFAQVTEPVIFALRQVGLDAEFRPKSHIYAAGKKISGNAQYATSGRMFSHGTLLFDSNLPQLKKALRPRLPTAESKSIKSVRSEVTNIRQLLATDMDAPTFKQAFQRAIAGQTGLPTYPLTPADWQQIQDIAAERYRQWPWTYGRSPRFTVVRSKQFPTGQLTAHIDVKAGRIETLTITGDLPSSTDLTKLQNYLTGTPYDAPNLTAALENPNISQHLKKLTPSDLLTLLY